MTFWLLPSLLPAVDPEDTPDTIRAVGYGAYYDTTALQQNAPFDCLQEGVTVSCGHCSAHLGSGVVLETYSLSFQQ